jgi:hypothetical protein
MEAEVEEVLNQVQELTQVVQEEQVEEEQEHVVLQEHQEQLTLEEEVVEQENLLVYQQEVQEVQVSLLLEDQVQQDLAQHPEQTQLQHYRHQLEVVKWLHSRFLETLQLANYLLFTNPIKIII